MILISLAGGSAPSAAAQHASRWRVDRGDELHARMRPGEALAVFERLLESDSTDYAVLWRAARESVSLGMLADGGESAATCYRKAERYARRAVGANPDDPQGHHWLAVALGRQALDAGIRARIHLSAEIRKEAEAALALDSLHAGANHVLGQWHAEVMRQSGVGRFLARSLLGAEGFEDASWEAARRHLERAVRFAPGMLIHRLELARLYMELDQVAKARAELRQVVELPAVEPIDGRLKEEARALLERLPAAPPGPPSQNRPGAETPNRDGDRLAPRGEEPSSSGADPLARSLHGVPEPAPSVSQAVAHVASQVVPPVFSLVPEILGGTSDPPASACSLLGRHEEGDARADHGAEGEARDEVEDVSFVLVSHLYAPMAGIGRSCGRLRCASRTII